MVYRWALPLQELGAGEGLEQILEFQIEWEVGLVVEKLRLLKMVSYQVKG